MYIELKKIEQGALQAHVKKQKQDRDKLFDLVMSLSDFAHDKGLSDVSAHLEDVLDTILKNPQVRQAGHAHFTSRRPAPHRAKPRRMTKAQRLILTSDLKRKRRAQS